MHLDVGVVDFKSQTHEPSANVEPHASSDDFSSLAGRAAAVSVLRSYEPGTYDCIGDFGMHGSHGCLASLTCCEQPPGLVGSHSLDESQMQWTPVCDDMGTCHAQGPTFFFFF